MDGYINAIMDVNMLVQAGAEAVNRGHRADADCNQRLNVYS